MKNKGFSLIELCVVMAILALLLMGSVGMVTSYITNAKLRGVADELKDGILLAKAEAIKRNITIDFVAKSNGSWEVCSPLSANTGVPVDADGHEVLQARTSDATNIIVSGKAPDESASSVIEFSGSGRPNPTMTAIHPTSNPSNDTKYVSYFDIKSAGTKSCLADGGDITCLRVLISSGGKVKVCNPTTDNEIYRCPT